MRTAHRLLHLARRRDRLRALADRVEDEMTALKSRALTEALNENQSLRHQLVQSQLREHQLAERLGE